MITGDEGSTGSPPFLDLAVFASRMFRPSERGCPRGGCVRGETSDVPYQKQLTSLSLRLLANNSPIFHIMALCWGKSAASADFNASLVPWGLSVETRRATRNVRRMNSAGVHGLMVPKAKGFGSILTRSVDGCNGYPIDSTAHKM